MYSIPAEIGLHFDRCNCAAAALDRDVRLKPLRVTMFEANLEVSYALQIRTQVGPDRLLEDRGRGRHSLQADLALELLLRTVMVEHTARDHLGYCPTLFEFLPAFPEHCRNRQFGGPQYE